MSEDPDNPALDWGEDADTHLDGAPIEASGPITAPHPVVQELGPDTSPHRSLDYLGGRETGYTEGVNAVLADLAAELREVTYLTETEILLVVGRLRGKSERKG